jgi:hypothetical protein
MNDLSDTLGALDESRRPIVDHMVACDLLKALIERDKAELARLRKAVRQSEAHYEELEKACEEFKSTVLFSRKGLQALSGLQTSLVLDVYADTIGAAIDYTKGDTTDAQS